MPATSSRIPCQGWCPQLVLLLTVTAAPLAAGDEVPFDNAGNPPRLKRADSFFGIHFDFHAGDDCNEIGKNTTPAMVENIIDQVRPDYLQVDCKGHRGLSSYPTRVGNQAPGFVGNPLRVWREVTARRGVSLYMHYSGVWDSEAILKHPDWGAVNADGKTNPRATSFFSPYADKLLIPQLRELAGVYGVDGAWVDGECWASVPDYGEAALRAFREATGIREIPRRPEDPHWFEFLEFHREAFRKYLRHYLAEVKQTHPQFEICSNWAFTDHMAEPISVPLDFLSGDYAPEDSVNSARLSARYLVRQGKAWDLMAWSFARSPGPGGRTQKSPVQLQREAAVVVALGGGFQAYFKQKRDGSIYDEQVPVMAEVAKFCRARQAICHRCQPVPQVAVLLSTAGHYRRIRGLFNRELAPVHGALQALVENQLSVEVVGEHQIQGRMGEYPLIVVPEWEYLAPEFRNDLLAYVRTGGKLLLIGVPSARLFSAELNVALADAPDPQPHHLNYSGTSVPIAGPSQPVVPAAGTRSIGQLSKSAEAAAADPPAATVTAYGQGTLAAVHFALGESYRKSRAPLLRTFTGELVRQLFPRPLVAVTGSADVDVSLARNHGKLLINLVNTSGPHQRQPIFDSIDRVGPLEVAIRLPQAPARVTWQPGGEAIPFEYREGEVRLAVPRLDIHGVLVVE